MCRSFKLKHFWSVSGLVKLNYSGGWSVRDVWESGGWEPRADQLTWQQYELAAALYQVSQKNTQDSVICSIRIKQDVA